ncbi:MAG: hypothetical protein KF725_03760 [Cyclobacteriaceae bacterium]|jgi:hypothetical protein|nr:hypothetical protein [Cyclobacteriaceae bacterium]MBX2944929.1 hypothetical protein [Cyclobacteriaceae bacterium]MBX2958033.1 hypothetical protein [Cyclobacteriaceae bacterium]HRJ29633.1 hypothetical protein [Cyclobacteriaceae bacterium]HRJ81419.1 hypothetical protein [Cyclobacteriaceae bacterium]
MEKRWVDKIYTFLVDAEGQPVSKKFDLDKNVKVVHGIVMSSDKPNLLFYRGSQRIELSGEELYPEDFESKMFMSGLAVPPDQKYKSLGNGVVAGNGELKIQFKDTHNPNAAFSAYKVIIGLLCEMK